MTPAVFTLTFVSTVTRPLSDVSCERVVHVVQSDIAFKPFKVAFAFIAMVAFRIP